MPGDSICDFLFSADLLVPHPRDAVAQMIETIGLPAPGPGAYVDYPLSGYDCVFALVNKAWAVGPTRLEVIGPKHYPDTPDDNRGARIDEAQGENPCKTHATVVATPDLGALTEHVRSLGLRHWLQEGSPDETGFDRLWMGFSAEDENAYEPEADAGLFIEVIPSESPAFVPKLFQVPPPEPENPTPGQLLRIVSRSYLVRDLDRSLETLATNLMWDATDVGIIDDAEAGGRHAVMSRNYEQGAALKLVQPRPGTPAGEHLERYGDGPFTIRIAVHDLDAKREELRSRGTAFTDLPATEHEPERVAIDPAATAAMPFELIEFGSASA
jgi:hypothetical protein